MFGARFRNCDKMGFAKPLASAVLSFVLGVGMASVSFAGEVRVQVARGPYYLGEAFEVQVIATDFDEDPTPKVSTGVYGGGSLRFLSVSPSTSTSITIVNGKMTRLHEVTFVYRYEFMGTREGRVRIPEFLVEQGEESESTQGFDLQIAGVPTTDAVSISLDLPEGPIFVGQKIPIAIEFRIDRQMQRDLVSYQIHVPLFESPSLRFLDEPIPDADTQLEISTESGGLRLMAKSSEKIIQGRSTLIVRAERIMIAVAPEVLHVGAPKVFIVKGVGFRRDVFNQRRATSSERFVAMGRPLEIEVAEVPRDHRPASFAGAVGKGFSLEVSADRSVVQLGEPIHLSFHLRGDGDLSSASLPPLDAEGLFDSKLFRLPEESPAGILDEDGKHFEITLRVLDSSVREIPALRYSWFDADTRRFEKTESRPIALSVGAAQIIGAEAVARRPQAREELSESSQGIRSAALSPSRDSVEGVIRGSSLSFTGANLAVVRDPARLLQSNQTSEAGQAMTFGLYGLGIAVLGFALVDRRRRSVDPVLRQRAEVYQRAAKDVEESFALPEDVGAAALGRALRQLVADLPLESGPDLDRLIADCDTLRFAPELERSIPESLRERTRSVLADRSKLDPNRGERE